MAHSPKLLLTGASGFIGSRLALRTRAQSHEFVAIGMANTPAERARIAELEAAGVEIRLGNLKDARFVGEAVQGMDAVIHLAAAQHEANVPDSYFMDVNVEGTRALLDASMRAGVRRFVYGSTIGVYGAAHFAVLDESSHLLPDSAYGRSKVRAEQLVRSYADKLETTVIRISETYGPGDYRLLKLFNAVARGVFVMIGKGENKRQPIHVDDLVRGLLLAARHPAAHGETFVLAGPEVLTTRQMIASIRAAFGQAGTGKRLPLWPFMAVASLMEGTLRPLGIQPPLHRRRLDFFVKSFHFDTRKAQSLLGFESQIPFSKGALDTAQWYCAQALLKATRLNETAKRGQIY
jgi:nucleoside-diphosphate-sugar epimerase